MQLASSPAMKTSSRCIHSAEVRYSPLTSSLRHFKTCSNRSAWSTLFGSIRWSTVRAMASRRTFSRSKLVMCRKLSSFGWIEAVKKSAWLEDRIGISPSACLLVKPKWRSYDSIRQAEASTYGPLISRLEIHRDLRSSLFSRLSPSGLPQQREIKMGYVPTHPAWVHSPSEQSCIHAGCVSRAGGFGVVDKERQSSGS